MFLSSIQLIQFRNHSSTNIKLTEQIIGICGKNGSGKTNLLDAIYYLSITKSYFNRTDNSNTLFNKDGFRLTASYQIKNLVLQIEIVYRNTQKKEVLLNGEKYLKYADHLGKFPSVFIAPENIALINDSSDCRRKFMDTIFGQLDNNYLTALINYNKILLNRNILLKMASETNQLDNQLLEIYNNQLVELGNNIYERRNNYMQELILLANTFYQQISQTNELVRISYKSDLEEKSFAELLTKNFNQDLAAQRTLLGIHKDDIDFFLNNQSFKQMASQGQKKSLILSLKLAEWKFLKKINQVPPFLLLDDLFEKLDETRIDNLLNLINQEGYSQIFITDPNEARLSELLKKKFNQFQIVHL